MKVNENNVPNSGNGVPSSGYPNSGVPNHGYPNPGYPNSAYPNHGYPNPPYPHSGVRKKSHKVQNITIAILLAIIAVLSVVAVIVLNRPKPQIQEEITIEVPEVEIVPGSVMLNGAAFDYAGISDGKTYVSAKELAEAVGYSALVEGETVKIVSQTEIVTLEIASKTVKKSNKTTGRDSTVEITVAPFESNGKIYVYARDLAMYLDNASVRYDDATQKVVINIGAVEKAPDNTTPPADETVTPEQETSEEKKTQPVITTPKKTKKKPTPAPAPAPTPVPASPPATNTAPSSGPEEPTDMLPLPSAEAAAM